MTFYIVIGSILLILIFVILSNYLYKKRLFNRAYKLNRKGDLKNAIIIYDQLIKMNPKNYIYFNNRGNCYFCMDEFELAKKDFLKSIELEPSELENYKAYENLSNIEKGYLG